MGLSGTVGLPLGTCCGGIDPYIPVFLLTSKKCSNPRASCARRRFARGAIRNDSFQRLRNEPGRRGAGLLMKAVVSELPADSLLRKQPGWLEHEAVVGVIFSLKTYAASLLALFIAFWAALDDPRWAVLT